VQLACSWSYRAVYFASAGVHIYSNTLVGINSSPPVTPIRAATMPTPTPEDPEDGARGGLEVERVEVAEVAPGQRCGDDDQQRGQDAVEGRPCDPSPVSFSLAGEISVLSVS
jgi:hypothetical protein